MVASFQSEIQFGLQKTNLPGDFRVLLHIALLGSAISNVNRDYNIDENRNNTWCWAYCSTSVNQVLFSYFHRCCNLWWVRRGFFWIINLSVMCQYRYQKHAFYRSANNYICGCKKKQHLLNNSSLLFLHLSWFKTLSLCVGNEKTN